MPVFTSSIELSDDYPSVEPSLKLNFAGSRSLDPCITFTRSSVGTYVGRDGLIKTAGENEPRFDHDPETLESLGLMIEEPRTNLAEYGTIVGDSNGWYNRPAFNTAVNNSISPDGTQNATLLTNLNAESDPDLYSFEQYAIGSNKTITHTIYVKSPDAANVGKEINFRGKRTVGTASSWGQKFILTAEWQRVTITHTYQADNTQGRAYIGADPNTSHPAGAATSCLFWGLQVEEGSFATSFIPTSGSTVTRADDKAEVFYDGWYDNGSSVKPSTFVGKFQTYNLSATRMVAEGSNGVTLRDFSMNTMSNSSNFQFVHRYTANDSYGSTSAGITINTPVTFAFSFDGTGGDITGSANGSTPTAGTDDLGGTTAGGDRMRIGSRANNSLYLNGTISELRYYKFKASSAQLLLLQ